MRAARGLIAGALLLTLLVYWIGLQGPFLLDDANNLTPIAEWLNGQDTWKHALLSNNSGVFGRSLSMATLMASAWLGGYAPWSFKLGNLLVHLLCGFVGWQMLRRAIARDPHLRSKADLTAAFVAALWLLHPLNVSTVLYAVQRMAQISTLFVLAAVWVYLSARSELQHGHSRAALIRLFLWFPLLTLLGLLGKENAAVAPALCLVLEFAYFRSEAATKRVLQIFYGVFLALPGLLLAGLLLLRPGHLLGAYAGRDFTLKQRLLSEGRALMDYVGTLLLPRGGTMSLFSDDFAISTGLMSPPTTLYALFALASLSILAIILRRRAPSVFAGWFFFLVAHAIESSFLPLELYFEHRNYLPAFGLLLATVGVLELITRKLPTEALSRRKLAIFAGIACALVLGFATHTRAMIWGDEGRLLGREAQSHPGSLRANLAITWYGIHHDNIPAAQAAIERLVLSPDARTRELGHINRVLADCIREGSASGDDLEQAIALARPIITLPEMYAFEDLVAVSTQRECHGANPSALADTIIGVLEAAHDQPDGQLPKWRLQLAVAQLYAQSDEWQRALPHAKLAWQPSADAPVGAFLVRVYVHNNLKADAEHAYAEVAQRMNPNDAKDERGLAELRKFLDRAQAEAGQPAGAK